MKRVFAWSFVALLLVMSAWSLNEQVYGHASLLTTDSNIQPGQVLNAEQVPAMVTLTFSEELAERSAIWVLNVTNALDEIVDTGKAGLDLDNADRNTLTAELPTLSPGLYQIKWVAITANDLGFSEGAVLFSVQ